MDDFDCWSGVNKEIMKGVKLREEKHMLYCPISTEYEKVYIDINKPSCSKSAPWYNLTSCDRRKNEIRQFSHNFTNYRRNTNVTKKRKKRRTNKIFHLAKNRCPLRVAELSVPSKRRCLETWRNNKDILPSFMVERLRQIIMDEKPIVKIYDAIDCFKGEKKSKTRPLKRRLRNRHGEHLRLFCALLSYKIIQKLQQPLNLTLNSKLQTLSRVVNNDITNILNNTNNSKRRTNKIQTEIADKITLWITNVLEESSYKLLLEDFEELKEEEGPVWDLIDELIDNVVDMCKAQSTAVSGITNVSSLASILIPTINETPSISFKGESIEKFSGMDIQQGDKNYSILSQILDNIFEKEALSFNESIICNNDNKIKDSHSERVINTYTENLEESTLVGKDYSNEIEDTFSQQKSLIQNDLIKNELQNFNDMRNLTVHDDGAKNLNTPLNIKNDKEDTSNLVDANKEIEKVALKRHSGNQNIDIIENQIGVQNEDTSDDSNNDIQNFHDMSNRISYDDGAKNLNALHNTKADEEDTSQLIETNKEIEKVALKKHSGNQNMDIIENQIEVQNDDTPDDTKNDIQNFHDMSNTISYDDGAKNLNALHTTKADEEETSRLIETNKEIERVMVKRNSGNQNMEIIENQIEVQNDDTQEDSIKKVKFSNLNIGFNVRKNSQNNTSDIPNREERDNNLIKHYKEGNIWSELQFALPNMHLLSDADESWPENLHFPVLKATVSVSKSVLSMGRIFENEERQFESIAKDSPFRADDVNTDSYDAQSSYSTDNTNILTKSLFPNYTTNGKEIHKDIELHRTENNTEVNQFQNESDSNFNEIKQRKNFTKTQTTQTSQTAINMTLVHLPLIEIKSNEQWVAIKINHVTAVQTHDHRLCKTHDDMNKHQIISSEDVFTKLKHKQSKISSKLLCNCTDFIEGHHLKSIEAKKWCEGLENVMYNLELWTNWMETTCSCIISLKKKGLKRRFAKQDSIYMWIKLKCHVDSDSIIWQRLSRKLKNGISNNRTYYVNK